MKLVLIIFFLAIVMTQAQEQDTTVLAPTPRFEIGVLLGEPVGISAKFWHGTITATDVAAAWSFTENGLFEMYIDFLIHPFNLRIFGSGGNFPVYIGAGFAARVGNEWFLGGRVPIGVEYIFNAVPFTLFAEVAPQWQFVPNDKFVLSGGAGIRIKFGSVK